MENNGTIFKSDRQGHIARWKASGKTQKDYCDQQGITYSTFCWWVKQEKQKGKTKAKTSGFIPVKVQDRSASVEISVGQVSVKVFA
jgi:hypothetical protein